MAKLRNNDGKSTANRRKTQKSHPVPPQRQFFALGIRQKCGSHGPQKHQPHTIPLPEQTPPETNHPQNPRLHKNRDLVSEYTSGTKPKEGGREEMVRVRTSPKVENFPTIHNPQPIFNNNSAGVTISPGRRLGTHGASDQSHGEGRRDGQDRGQFSETGIFPRNSDGETQKTKFVTSTIHEREEEGKGNDRGEMPPCQKR